MNFIFDFDGTLVDSLGAFVSIFNKSVRGGQNPLTDTEINRLRNMSSRKAIKNLGVRWWQLPKLLLQGIPDFHAMLPSLHTFEGLPEVLRDLHKRGDKLFIVTSNTHENVALFLRQHKLEGYFTDISGGAGPFKKAKHIRRLMRTYKIKRKNTVYVGDETRDIQAARLALVRVVSVGWGFNTLAILRKQKPNFVVRQPKELLSVKLQ